MGRRAAGFTYLGVIILVAIIALVGATLLKVDAMAQRAAREEELLEIGAQFSQALASYAAATPPGQPQQPATLAELLKDPRFPNTRRHLRKIFVDPMTGKAEWGMMYLGDKTGVVAVYSLSDAAPLKIANFDTRFPNFANKAKISDWRFTASSGGVISSGGVTNTPMTPPPIPVIMPTTPVEPPAEPPPEARPPRPADPNAPAEQPSDRGDTRDGDAGQPDPTRPDPTQPEPAEPPRGDDQGGQDGGQGGQGGAVFQNPDKPAQPPGTTGGKNGGAQRPER